MGSFRLFVVRHHVALVLFRFGNPLLELDMFMVEARNPREAATACYVEKFGVEPQDADNFRDTSRTSTGKMARISLPAPGTPIDNSLVGVFTFDRYGEMTGTIMVRDTPFPEEPLWA